MHFKKIINYLCKKFEMKITKTKIKDLLIIEPDIFGDERGFFMETWNHKRFLEFGIDFLPIQQNESISVYGVIRGLHYQLAPYSQAKLVRVVVGNVLDVAVDLRKNSPTFGKYVTVELSSENKKQFLIPRGFAHGFSVLSEIAVFQYFCDNFYNKDAEKGILFNDEFFNINWQIPELQQIISEKDKNNKLFNNAEINF